MPQLDSSNISSLEALRLVRRKEAVFLLIAFVITPLVSGLYLYHEHKRSLQEEIGNLCVAIRAQMNTGAHHRLVTSPAFNEDLRDELLDPLARIHLSNPKIMYIYSMSITDNGVFYILDTMQDPATLGHVRKRYPNVSASEFGDKYEYMLFTAEEQQTFVEQGLFVDEEVYIEGQDRIIGCMATLGEYGADIEVIGVDYDAGKLESIELSVIRSVLIGLVVGALFLMVYLSRLRAYLLEKEALIARLDRLSSTDTLTEIANRRSFFIGSQNLILNAETGDIVSAAVIDIDFFKKINDRHGHMIGDEALKLFAKLLNRTCNPRKFVIGRIGGEEFAVCCVKTEEADMGGSLLLLRSLLQQSPVSSPEGDFTLSFSGGFVEIELVDETRPDVATMMAKADEALYQAKNAGRDRMIRYETEQSNDQQSEEEGA